MEYVSEQSTTVADSSAAAAAARAASFDDDDVNMINSSNPAAPLYHVPPQEELSSDVDESTKQHVPQAPVYFKESDVSRYSRAELQQLGLGRTPTGYCYSTRMLLHAPLSTRNEQDDPHPEQPARIEGIYNRFVVAGVVHRMTRIAIREVLKDEAKLVHSESHWQKVRALGYQSDDWLASSVDYFQRLSLYVNDQSAFSARLSCGGVIEMCRAVAEGQIRNGFAIVRPPGHHAEPEDPMGFCFFNNAAVTARWLTTVYESSKIRMKKVLVLDWDVHHGNGTQKAFWEDSDILYISLHRHDGQFYPGGMMGEADMVGEEGGQGFNVNIPFPDAGMTDADYLYAFQRVVMPIAYEFAPDFVIVSAGYDAADGDDLGKMKVSPAGFAHMTHMLSVLAGGKLVLALEGGYNVDSIANSALACVKVLLGDDAPPLELKAASLSATEAVHKVTMIQKKYWKCMGQASEGLAELRDAGTIISIPEILKSHRTWDLYHRYNLYNIGFAEPRLEALYKDQLLCSSNVYSCETLIIFMHDLGYIKASLTAVSLDIEPEKSALLDTSRLILDWATRENDFGIVDVNFLPHSTLNKGNMSSPQAMAAQEKRLGIYVWDQIATISSAKNIILIGNGIACNALIYIIGERPSVVKRVKACVSVVGYEPPASMKSEMREWYRENSLVILPASHTLHEVARRGPGKIHKKYGNVVRCSATDESRPLHLLKASMPKIDEFIKSKLLTTNENDTRTDRATT